MAIQLLFTDCYYLTIDGQQLSLESKGPNSPLLNSENSTPFVHKSLLLTSGEDDVLDFTDSPSIPLGRGCWISADSIGIRSAAGFQVAFRVFVLQDWDSTDSNIQQTPIGGYTVASWRNQAKTYLNDQEQWQVNGTMTELQQPSPSNAPFAYAPSLHAHCLPLCIAKAG